MPAFCIYQSMKYQQPRALEKAVDEETRAVRSLNHVYTLAIVGELNIKPFFVE